MVLVMAEMLGLHITVKATAVAVDVGRQGAPADVVERRSGHLPRHGRVGRPDGAAAKMTAIPALPVHMAMVPP